MSAGSFASAAAALSPPAIVRALFRRWLEKRLRRSDVQLLTQRNIYILPTRAGWMFAITLLVLLLASVNYQLNLGYVLTFLLAGSGIVSMHVTHATLRGLTLHLRRLGAGLRGDAGGARRRADEPGLAALRHRPAPARRARSDAGLDRRPRGRPGDRARDLRAATVRGRHEVPALSAETRFPLGLFRAWTVWRPAARAARLSEARGAGRRALPAARPIAGGPTALRSSEGGEVEGVRAYRRGDPLKLIAWKKAAQAFETGGELVSRDTSASAQRELWLDWPACGALDPEAAPVAPGRLGRRRARAATPLRPAPARPRDRAGGGRRAAPALPGGAGAWHERAASPACARRCCRAGPAGARLPREARDTLFLLGVIAWTSCRTRPTCRSGASRSPRRAALARPPRARQRRAAGALGPGRRCSWSPIALTFWSYRTLLGKEPGVTLAVVLMALKTLELRARRDAFVVFFLGFFIVLTHFLYSQSLPSRRRCWSRCGACSPRWCSRTCRSASRACARRRRSRRAPRCSARRSWRCCSCCFRASARSGACRRTASRRPACRTP